MIQKGIIEVTIDCNINELEKIEDNHYRIRWIGGEEKIITVPRFKFAVQSMPQALNDVAVLCALNDNVIRAIGLKVI